MILVVKNECLGNKEFQILTHEVLGSDAWSILALKFFTMLERKRFTMLERNN